MATVQDVTDEVVHIVQADDYQAVLVCDFSVPNDHLACEIGRALADDYWSKNPGCAVEIRFADYTYYRLDLKRMKTWR